MSNGRLPRFRRAGCSFGDHADWREACPYAWIILRDGSFDIPAGCAELVARLPKASAEFLYAVTEFPLTPGGTIDSAKLYQSQSSSDQMAIPADSVRMPTWSSGNHCFFFTGLPMRRRCFSFTTLKAARRSTGISYPCFRRTGHSLGPPREDSTSLPCHQRWKARRPTG